MALESKSTLDPRASAVFELPHHPLRPAAVAECWARPTLRTRDGVAFHRRPVHRAAVLVVLLGRTAPSQLLQQASVMTAVNRQRDDAAAPNEQIHHLGACTPSFCSPRGCTGVDELMIYDPAG